jgi:hypothetical protein
VIAVASPGPIIGADLWRQVVTAAFGRCVCSGQCGQSHKKYMGRCPAEDAPGKPLHVVSRQRVNPGIEITLGPADLMALCDGCHGRLLVKRRNELRAELVAEMHKSSGSLF